jgi:uncharacterized protein
MNSSQTVAVLGASANPERYANMAVRRLRDAGHRVIPVNPALEQIEGLPVTKSLGDIAEPVDTLTLYVGPQRLAPLTEDILRLAPQRVIFNPGTIMASTLRNKLPKGEWTLTLVDRANIPHLEACTLVMLQTSQF